VKRIALVLTSAGLGVALVVSLASLASQLGLVPRFPAHGGDDDFNLRAGVFFLLVCPAFALLGGVIGHAYGSDLSRAVRAWLGAAVGTATLFGLARLLAGWVERIETRELANAGAVVFLVALPAFAALGARAAARSVSRRG
jgi:hypothetical protein